MSSLVRRARARLATAAAVGGLVAATSLTVLAPPAGAQLPPARPEARPVDVATSRLDAGIAAVLQALSAAQEAREAAAGDRGCVDAGPPDVDVPRMVVEIFRCRLLEAGYADDEARRVAAEAVVVARCESAFKKNAVVFDGRYAESAHPRTGYRYTAAGVFQFIRKTADEWIEPDGYARVFAPRRNIDAAARLYLHNRANGLRGWEDWACAAVNDGFKQGGSVLPGWVGGPAELPAWAWKLANAA